MNPTNSAFGSDRRTSVTGTQALDGSALNHLEITAGAGNIDMNVSGIRPGQIVSFVFNQDGVGGRTITINAGAGLQTPSFAGAGTIAPNAGAGARTLYLFVGAVASGNFHVYKLLS